jgi:PAS domain S-box-containing protein
VLAAYPETITLFLLSEKAVSVASYSAREQVPVGIDYSGLEHIESARATRQVAISGNLRGRTTGRPAVVFSVPLVARDGSVRGFLNGSAPPENFHNPYNFAPERFRLVLDGFGRVVSATNTADSDALAAEVASAPYGESRFESPGAVYHLNVLDVKPLGWKIVVGVPDSYLQAQGRQAVRRAVLVALLFTLIGAAAASVVAFSTVRGLDGISRQVQRMSPVDLRPIELSKTALYPHEVRSLVDNFNNLLARTVKSKHAELEAITRVADTILIARADGQVTYVNEAGAKLFGDVIGKPLRDIVGAETAASILSPGRLRGWKGDISIQNNDGAAFDAFFSSTPIYENEALTAIVAIIQDITHEKAARDAVSQSEKMITLGELVAGTSHELNNPLAVVTGYSDLLLEEGQLTGEQRSKVESIRKSAMRASKVVHSLLAFARKRKPERVSTDVNAVVEAAVRLKEYDLRTSGIHIDTRLASNLPPVFADPHQIQQVLLNVINNAQDAVLAGPNPPKIVVSTEILNSTVCIQVEDTGSGISKSDLRKVFDPFFTTKPLGKGAGLGLSISYGIIREHGGDIRIQSRPREGTQVCIELPVDAAAASAPAEASGGVYDAGPRRFLVVDDEPEIMAIVKTVLLRNGSVVDGAATIHEALALTRKNVYDFIITDIKMPGGSGIDLYRQLCATNPSYRHRVIFLTGDTSNPGTMQFLEEEGLLYFSKPVDFEALGRFFRDSNAGSSR